MNDTPPDVDELYRRMLLRRSPEERLRMACRMFSSARALARAGMPAASGAQIRRQMFLRLYAEDRDGSLSVDGVWDAVKRLRAPLFYLSGPPQMLSALRAQLLSRGVSAENVRTDAWE